MSGLFTIEQTELIRRLRNSGITKEQICQAFDSLTRLDGELGCVYNTRDSSKTSSAHVSSSHAKTSNVSQRRFSGANHESTVSSNGSISPSSPHDEFVYSPRPHGSGVSQFSNVQDNSPEMVDLLSKGEDIINEEVRNFITKYNIRQHTIGYQVGLSQSYVSRYCRGDYFDMSDKSKKAIYRWYITVQKKIAENENGDPQPMIDYLTTTAASSHFVPYPRKISDISTDSYQKRERFTFRPAHLEILESYFQTDSYPNAEARDDIAAECNRIAPVVGKEVTAQIIANWFANKRKELKKMTKSGKTVPSNAHQLRDRCGRPSNVERYSMDEDRLAEDQNEDLSQQVELAAVSQAILSLSGIDQSNSNPEQDQQIKEEFVDDDEYSN